MNINQVSKTFRFYIKDRSLNLFGKKLIGN